MKACRIFRDVTQLFLPNKNFTSKYGFLLSELIDDKLEVKVITFQKFQQDEKLYIKDLYKKYSEIIPSFIGLQLVQYFEIDEINGEDSDCHIDYVEQQLKQLKNVNDNEK